MNTRQSVPKSSSVFAHVASSPLSLSCLQVALSFLFVCLPEAYYLSVHLAVSQLALSCLITGCQGKI